MSSTEPAARELGRQGRVPDFFIVGHHKSGTTAMYGMLRRHPQIFMPTMKEPEFFREDRLRRKHGPPRSSWRPGRYAATRPPTFAEYLALFAPAEPDQRVGEASPGYLFSPAAAGLIAEVQPAARIIAILREPASFLRSLHLQMVSDQIQRELDFRRALAGEAGPSALQYTGRVRYVEQLRRYHGSFPPEQVLVLIYDDFRADNVGTMRSVLRFLDVDPDAPIEALDANPTVAVRSRTLEKGVRTLRAGRGPVARGVKTTFQTLTPNRTQRDIVRAFGRHLVYRSSPPADESLMIELRRRFKPEVVALSEYLGRDLVRQWGYDRLD
jgi:hypothetical protein